MSFKSIAWNEEEQTVRGSFVNMVVSFVYMVMIVLGCFFSKISTNMENMATLLIGFFTVSFGIWGGKKVIENMQNIGTVGDTVNDLLQKVGIKVVNAPIPPESTEK